VHVDPLPRVELEAALADGQEIVGEQGREPVGIGMQLGVVGRVPFRKDLETRTA
jgi:hypothetical protein